MVTVLSHTLSIQWSYSGLSFRSNPFHCLCLSNWTVDWQSRSEIPLLCWWHPAIHISDLTIAIKHCSSWILFHRHAVLVLAKKTFQILTSLKSFILVPGKDCVTFHPKYVLCSRMWHYIIRHCEDTRHHSWWYTELPNTCQQCSPVM